MSTKQFVDRDDLKREISTFFAEHSGNSACLLIGGVSGVGKSALVDEICGGLPDQHFVRVGISAGTSRTLQSGSYIRKIAACIDAFSKEVEDANSYESRQRMADGFSAVREAALLATDLLITKRIREAVLKIGEAVVGGEDRQKAFALPTPEGTVELARYVLEILKEVPIGLVIENAQDIDEFSSDTLKSILTISPHSKVIFEFTLATDTSTNSLAKYRDEFALVCPSTQIRLVKKLPLEYVVQIIPESYRDARNWISQSYASWDGNLVPLVDVELAQFDALSSQISIAEHDLSSKLSMLTNDEQQIFLYILVVGGEIRTAEMIEIHRQSQPNFTNLELDAALIRLSELNLIKSHTTAELRLATDSYLEDQSVSGSFLKSSVLAADAVRRHLENKVPDQCGDGSDPYLLQLLLRVQIYLEDAQGALRSFTSLCERTAAELSPTSFREMLEDVAGVCSKNGVNVPSDLLERLRLELLATCIRTRVFQPCEHLLKLSYLPTSREKVAHALVYLGTERPDEAQAIATEIMADDDLSETILLYGRIVSYIALRHLGRLSDGRAKWSQSIAESKDGPQRPFGFMLRNAEMFTSPRESIKPIIASIRVFRSTGDTLHEAYSLNSLGGQLVRVGRFAMGKACFERALAVIGDATTDRGSIVNNLAISRIRLGEDPKTLSSLFEEATITTSSAFERLALANNLANLSLEAGDTDSAYRFGSIARRMVQARHVSSPQINHTVSLSVQRMAEDLGCPDLALPAEAHSADAVVEEDAYTIGRSTRRENRRIYVLLANWYPDIAPLINEVPEGLR